MGPLAQVMLGKGEGNAGEGVCAQVAFLVAECPCCALRAGLATSTHSAALPGAVASRRCTRDNLWLHSGELWPEHCVRTKLPQTLQIKSRSSAKVLTGAAHTRCHSRTGSIGLIGGPCSGSLLQALKSLSSTNLAVASLLCPSPLWAPLPGPGGPLSLSALCCTA